MIENVLPLVFFTLLGQVAFGLVVGLAVMKAVNRPDGRHSYLQLRLPVTVVALLLMIAALIFSFFHLGSPLKAVYALSGWRTSWLSREIMMVQVFMIMLFVWVVLLKASFTSERVNTIILRLCLTAGFLMVFTMARLYMAPAIPAWDSLYTPVLFFGSSLIAGSSLFLTVVHTAKRGEAWQKEDMVYARVMVFVMLIAFLVRITFDLFSDTATADVAFPPAPVPMLQVAFYYLLMVCGITMMLLHAFVPHKLTVRSQRHLVFISFCLILAGELLGRYFFYAGYYRLGV